MNQLYARVHSRNGLGTGRRDTHAETSPPDQKNRERRLAKTKRLATDQGGLFSCFRVFVFPKAKAKRATTQTREACKRTAPTVRARRTTPIVQMPTDTKQATTSHRRRAETAMCRPSPTQLRRRLDHAAGMGCKNAQIKIGKKPEPTQKMLKSN